MADQQRWFKLWCSAPADNGLQELHPAIRWAWAAFGCYTKTHGTRGRVTVSASNHVLAAEMGVPTDALMATIAMLPHVHIQESHSVNGMFTVTWQNWLKYQEDSTIAKRVTRLRDKRRGEENKTRGESTTSSRAAQRETACRLIDFLNEKAGRSFRKVESTLRPIMARLEDGATEANCRGVIARKAREWHGTEMAKYLRPETLFNRTKFESYLGERTPEGSHGDVPPVQ